MRLIGDIHPVETLSMVQKEEMLELLKNYFEGVDKGIFLSDLTQKKWVILLFDAIDGSIKGFSTQTILDCVVGAEPIKALFSGDTIIGRDYWGSQELVKQWLRLVERLFSLYPGTRLYWFLISKGYKTYRYLPVFFKKFYPCYNEETPKFEKSVMDCLGYLKYPDNYSRTDGVIHFHNKTMCLKKGVAEVNDYRLKNPHVRFFTERNALHWKGDELVCLAELSYANFNPSVLRMQSVSAAMLGDDFYV